MPSSPWWPGGPSLPLGLKNLDSQSKCVCNLGSNTSLGIGMKSWFYGSVTTVGLAFTLASLQCSEFSSYRVGSIWPGSSSSPSLNWIDLFVLFPFCSAIPEDRMSHKLLKYFNNYLIPLMLWHLNNINSPWLGREDWAFYKRKDLFSWSAFIFSVLAPPVSKYLIWTNCLGWISYYGNPMPSNEYLLNIIVKLFDRVKLN